MSTYRQTDRCHYKAGWSLSAWHSRFLMFEVGNVAVFWLSRFQGFWLFGSQTSLVSDFKITGFQTLQVSKFAAGFRCSSLLTFWVWRFPGHPWVDCAETHTELSWLPPSTGKNMLLHSETGKAEGNCQIVELGPGRNLENQEYYFPSLPNFWNLRGGVTGKLSPCKTGMSQKPLPPPTHTPLSLEHEGYGTRKLCLESTWFLAASSSHG